MPKRGADPIPAEWLLTNRVHELDDDLRLSPAQVVMMTGLSLDMLKEHRRTRPPKPPLAILREKKGAKVWYRLADVLDWRRAKNPNVASKPRKGIDTFHGFMARGMPDDQWVFARTREGQPVDYFASLRFSDLLDHGAECVWLSLDEYLRTADEWARVERAKAQERYLSRPDVLPTAKSMNVCPRCGKSAHPGRSCRL